MSATPEHWVAIFRGALISIACCTRCVAGPNLKCRHCRVDLAAAGLAAYHLVNASGPDGAFESQVDASAEAEQIASSQSASRA